MTQLEDGPVYTPEEQQWLTAQRARVAAYLQAEQLAPGGVLAEEPELIMAPLLALWAVDGGPGQEDTGWWVVAGDVPTDHVSAQRAPGAREALGTFSKKWRTAASVMTQGGSDNADGVSAEQRREAAQHLFERAKRLWQIYENEALWA